MRYRLLGPSGVRVSELALGTMTFGETWGWGASREESRKIFDRFAEAGGNFVDTANNYTGGTSEEFVGEFTEADPDHFVIATKYSLSERRGDPNFGGNHRKNMRRSVEGSLRRLRTDHVDLLWLHMWDFTTPVEEVVRAMDDLVRAGKVLHVGFSDTPGWVVSRAITLAEWHGWPRPAAVQFPYSLVWRDAEREVIPSARGFGLAMAPWGVIGQGVLTGKYHRAKADPGETRRMDDEGDTPDPEELRRAEAVLALAREIGKTPSQVAINWVRQQRGTVIPIVGARTVAQMEDDLGSLEFELTSDQLNTLDEATRIPIGFPLSFLTGRGVRQLIFGSTFDQLEGGEP